MNINLSNQDIQQIFSAVEKKGIYYIDVQHEIVDHLATEIELNKKNSSKLNIQEEIDIAFGKLPSDFKKVIRSKEKSMNRYWQRRTFSYMKSYFQFPTIVSTLLLYIAIVAGSLAYGKYVLAPVLTIMIFTMAFTIVKLYKNSNYSRKKEKQYLVLKMFFGQTIIMNILPSTLLNVLQVFKPEDGSLYTQHWAIYIVSAIAVFTFMWNHACLTAFPKMLQNELDSKYPYLSYV